jgi:hypothetical protein
VKVDFLAVTVPVPPTAGVDLAQPAGALNETKVVLAGRTSVTTALVASNPDAFFAVSVYVMLLPAEVDDGPVFVI